METQKIKISQDLMDVVISKSTLRKILPTEAPSIDTVTMYNSYRTVRVPETLYMDARVFKKGSKVEALEKALNPDISTGISDWISIDDLTEAVGFSVAGNGLALIQDDRGLGTKYLVGKSYGKNNRKEVAAVRTTGFRLDTKLQGPSEEIKKVINLQRCVMCSTSTSIECDHKDGRKTSISDELKDFQPLCSHCNKVKRERCKECKKTGKRFDARALGYTSGWTTGGKYYDCLGHKCEGCYLYDVKSFIKEVTS